jgi:hypothetical protein
VRQQTVFVADDGTQFSDQATCAAHEALLARLKPIMARLPQSRPRGATYVQHDAETLRQVKRDLFGLVLERLGGSYPQWRDVNPDEVHPMSIVGRVLDDCGGPLAKAWSTLARYDFDTGREYEQPYFVAHPQEAVQA